MGATGTILAGSAAAGRRRGLATLLTLAAVLVAGGWALLTVVGWPALPTALPTWDELGLLARSPMISFAALRPVLVLVLWALWLWPTLSFVASLSVAVAERFAGDAAWVGALRAATALLACPPVRRAVHRALATAFAVSVATRGLTPVAAAPTPAAIVVERVVDQAPTVIAAPSAAPPSLTVAPIAAALAEARPAIPAAPVAVVRHTVAPGECLSRIAEWYYDDWKAYPRIARDPSNRIADPNLIYPAQVLVIRAPARPEPMPTVVAPPAGGEQTYRVRPADTLGQIAEATYGSPAFADAIYLRNWAAIPNPHKLYWGTTLVLPVILDAPTGPRPIAPPATEPSPAPAPPASAPAGPPRIAPTPPVDRWATEHRPATARPPADLTGAQPPSAVVAGPTTGPVGALVPFGPELRQDPIALAEELARRANRVAQDTAARPPTRTPGFVSVAQEFAQDRAAQVLLAAAVALVIGSSLTVARARPYWLRSRRGAALAGDDRDLAATVQELAAERARARQGLAAEPAPPAGAEATTLPPSDAESGVGASGWVSSEVVARTIGLLSGAAPTADNVAQAAEPAGRRFDHAAAVAGYLLAGLAAAGITRLRVLAARVAVGRLAFLLTGPLAEQTRLETLAPELAAAIGAAATVQTTPEGDALLTLIGPATPPPPASDAAPCLVPVGVIGPAGRRWRPGEPPAEAEALAIDPRTAGHLLVAGQPGSGVDIVVAGLLAALAARLSPELFGLRLVAAAHALPAELALLPHNLTRAIEPTNLAALDQLVAGLHHELARRIALRRQAPPARPPHFPLLVVAIAELAHLPVAAVDDLRALAGAGPDHGLVLLAATSRPATLPDGYLDMFATTLALRQPDEERSIRLLGTPDAAALAEAGELLVSLAGRPAVRVSGFQVTDEQLRALADRLIAAAPAEVGETACAATTPDSEPPAIDQPATSDEATEVDDLDRADDSDAMTETTSTEPPSAAAGPGRAGSPAPDAQPPAGPPTPVAPGAAAAAIVSVPVAMAPGAVETAPTTASPTDGPTAVAPTPVATAAPPPADEALARPAPLVLIECLGPLRVLAGDRALEPAGRQPGGQRRANQLAWEALAVLAACPEGEASLWTIARALYPDEVDAVDEAYLLKRARTALNDARAFLRGQVPALAGMLILHRAGGEGGRYRLDWEQIASDAREFRRGVEAARREAALPAATALGRALAHYKGHLLADRPPGGWPDELRVGGVHSSLRAYYGRLWSDAMDQFGHLCLQLGYPEQAATIFRRLFEQEPDDTVAAQLLRAYEAMGAARGAARFVQEDWAWICDLLREELDAEPTPELMATYAAIITALGGQPLPYPPTSARRRTAPLPLVRSPVIGGRPGGDAATPAVSAPPAEAHPAQA